MLYIIFVIIAFPVVLFIYDAAEHPRRHRRRKRKNNNRWRNPPF